MSKYDILIKIQGLSAGYADKTILNNISLDIPEQGLFCIMGPSGTGKTTLLRSIMHVNQLLPAYWANGQIFFKQKNLLKESHKDIVLLPQKARLYTGSVWENVSQNIQKEGCNDSIQRDHIAYQLFQPLGLWSIFKDKLDAPVMSLSMAQHKQILLSALYSTKPSCMLLDEPLSDISMAEENNIMSLVRKISTLCTVVLVTHNKQEAKLLSQTICLLSGDHLIEVTETSRFFTCPSTRIGAAFLKSGSSWAGTKDKIQQQKSAHFILPREFHWVIKNQLGGMQYPGLLGDHICDLSALQRLNIKYLVSLTETAYDEKRLQHYHITGIHFPIIDMDVPDLASCKILCQSIHQWLDNKESTVIHCKAGLGRTGTLLACFLVFKGKNAIEAIDQVRLINPWYIQNDIQFDFIGEFYQYLNNTCPRKDTINP